MNNSNSLLEKMTELLAYAGDEGAKDGYIVSSNNNNYKNNNNNARNNKYSIPIRNVPLSDEELEDLVSQLKNLLENDEPLVGIPEDIAKKANSLKAAFDKVASTNIKDELITYISAFEVNPMQGGARKRNNKKLRKSKRTIKKSRRNSKTRKSRK